MRIKITHGLFLTVSLLLFGCDYGVKWKDKPYEVHWIDIPKNLELVYDVGNGGSVGRVGPIVVAVGSNSKYVVAKTENERFYFIERAKDSKYGDNLSAVTGPLSEQEYQKNKTRLKLPNFSREF